jgi:nucleotide-binding universal stress UspA family protein
MKILFAVDGSAHSLKAARYIAEHFHQFREPLELHLVYVHPPIPRGLALAQAERLLGGDVEQRYYEEEAVKCLAAAEQVLRDGSIAFQSTHRVGEIAGEIRKYAEAIGADMIVMGSHGHGAFGNLVMGSVATKVVATAKAPVLIVR